MAIEPFWLSYSRDAILAAPQREALCDELGRALSERLAGEGDDTSEIERMVSNLKAVGHDLVPWNTDEGVRSFGAAYADGAPGLALWLVFSRDFDESSEAAVTTPPPSWTVHVSFGRVFGRSRQDARPDAQRVHHPCAPEPCCSRWTGTDKRTARR
jgi:hypothetical protein